MATLARPTTGTLVRVSDYANDVVSGRVVAGQYVRLACQRHLDDVALGGLRGLHFDDAAAERAILFIENLRHSKGEWAGQLFVLEPWQVFIIGSVFGWKRADGMRRFRDVHVEVARKQGKTQLLAAVALYLAFADGEPGAEVYTAATKRDQAKICWGEARRMAGATPALAKRLVFTDSKSNIAYPATHSKLEPLGRDADTADGLNPSAFVVDELHAHTNRDLVDVLETATGARRQPLHWYITTAGFNQESIWWEKRQYATNVLDGTATDDRLFVYLATLDKQDDWRDESVWVKANPNLGVSVRLDELREVVARAERVPAEQNNVRCKRLNQPTEQAVRWIDMAQWDACAGEPTIEAGAAVFVGLDMSSKVDLTAAVAVRMATDGYLDVLCRFWRPEESVLEAERRDGVPYRAWADAGYLTLTEGSMIDPGMVAEDTVDWLTGYEVREVPFDSWNAAGAAARLEAAGLVTVAMAQGYQTYSEPCHTFEGLLASGRIRHGGNPVLRWMAGQTQVKHGPNNAVRPWKPHGSGLRNDGVVALLMALNRVTIHQSVETSGPSFWDMGDTDATE